MAYAGPDLSLTSIITSHHSCPKKIWEMPERLMDPADRHLLCDGEALFADPRPGASRSQMHDGEAFLSRCHTRDSFGIQAFQGILDSCDFACYND